MLKLTKIEVTIGRKRKPDKERERRIQLLTSLLKEGTIDVGVFLDAMANKIIIPGILQIHKL